MQQEFNDKSVRLHWYESEGGRYVRKEGLDKYPAGAYGFVGGLYVRVSREDREAVEARNNDAIDRASEDSFPASDPPSH